MTGCSRSNLRIGHEPLCPGTTTTGARGSRGAIAPPRLPASKRWTDFGDVDRVPLRQFYGWSANRRAKLCASTFPCVHRHSSPTGAAAAFMIRPPRRYRRARYGHLFPPTTVLSRRRLSARSLRHKCKYTRGEPKDFNGLGGKKSLAAEWDRWVGASMPTASELSQRRRSCLWTNPLARTSARSHVIRSFPA